MVGGSSDKKKNDEFNFDFGKGGNQGNAQEKKEEPNAGAGDLMDLLGGIDMNNNAGANT